VCFFVRGVRYVAAGVDADGMNADDGEGDNGWVERSCGNGNARCFR